MQLMALEVRTLKLHHFPQEIKAALIREKPKMLWGHIYIYIYMYKRYPVKACNAELESPPLPCGVVQASRSAYRLRIYSIPRGCIPNTAPDLAWIRSVLLVRLLLPGQEHCRRICSLGAWVWKLQLKPQQINSMCRRTGHAAYLHVCH